MGRLKYERRPYELGDGTWAELDDRHLRVLADCLTGPTATAYVARRLNYSPAHIKHLWRDIFTELGVNDRTEAVVVALRAGMVTL